MIEEELDEMKIQGYALTYLQQEIEQLNSTVQILTETRERDKITFSES